MWMLGNGLYASIVCQYASGHNCCILAVTNGLLGCLQATRCWSCWLDCWSVCRTLIKCRAVGATGQGIIVYMYAHVFIRAATMLLI